MIYDTLSCAAQYAGLSPAFAKAFEFLKKTDFSTLNPGRYEIDGDRAFALVSAYSPKPCAEAKWEAHRQYADIQVLIEGAEKQGFAPLAQGKDSEGYLPDRDIEFLRVDDGNYITLKPGMFAVYFPQDLHQPGVKANDLPVKKIVVKVKA